MRTSTAMQRHDFDPIAFVFGALFTGFGILFMVGRFDLFNHARWLWPGLLVLLGIAVLVGARGRGGQGRERAPGAGSAVEPGPAAPVPDLDAIEPPVGPEAFRLPGWPPPGGEPSRAAAGSTTDVLEPLAPTEQEEPRHDPRAETEVIPSRPDPQAETEVIQPHPDPEAETELIPPHPDPEAETEILREPRRPEPPVPG
jgi:hypothetical protein